MRIDHPSPRCWRRALAGAATLAVLVTTAVAPSPASARTRPYLLGDSVVAWSTSAIISRSQVS